MTATLARRGDVSRRRLMKLMGAGLVDSFCLSLAWTVVVLELNRQHGLLAAGLCSTAMLVGVALSAPTATWMTQHLDGRRLLRTAGGFEAVLRASVIALLAGGAPVWLLAACVTAMNVVAWTGYAGMRAEVAAVSSGAGGLTWYGTIVAAVEALGVASGALVPLGAGGRPSTAVLAGVAILYVAALTPTLLVAGGSRVPRADRMSAHRPGASWQVLLRGRRPSRVTVLGAVIMMAASAPALLAVALAAELYGRGAVGLSAGAFTVGSLLAPALAGFVERTGRNHLTWWLMLATGMVLGWIMAAQAVIWLCLAQVLSGLFMTALEGLLDTRASQERPYAVTGALARATAARALGSSVGTAVLPVFVAGAGLSATTVVLTGVLAVLAVSAHVSRVLGRSEALLEAQESPESARSGAAATAPA